MTCCVCFFFFFCPKRYSSNDYRKFSKTNTDDIMTATVEPRQSPPPPPGRELIRSSVILRLSAVKNNGRNSCRPLFVYRNVRNNMICVRRRSRTSCLHLFIFFFHGSTCLFIFSSSLKTRPCRIDGKKKKKKRKLRKTKSRTAIHHGPCTTVYSSATKRPRATVGRRRSIFATTTRTGCPPFWTPTTSPPCRRSIWPPSESARNHQ